MRERRMSFPPEYPARRLLWRRAVLIIWPEGVRYQIGKIVEAALL